MKITDGRVASKAPTRWILWSLGVAAILFVGFAGYVLWHVAPIGTAYKAKVLCSGVFVAKRDPESILTHDLLVDDLAPLRHIDADIDYEGQSVTATLMGLAPRKATFRQGLGCTLLLGASEEQFRAQVSHVPVLRRAQRQDLLWPGGERIETDTLPPEVDAAKLGDALDAAFAEPDPDRLRRTRAVVVVYNGRIVAERYATGVSPATPLIGWSMTKSVVNALTGVLVREGKLSLQDRALVPEWRAPGDPRGGITLDLLLRMSSGLAFAEDYTNPLADVIYMLLGTDNVAAYAAHKPLEAEPGSKWDYSSGTTNIIARILRDAVGGTTADYFAFPRRALFDPIGMSSAIIEPDASGTFVGSSFMYANARDWARFGLLYLEDGVWAGERILPQGWVAYSRTPAPEAPSGEYGAHFWLEVPSYYRSGESQKWSLPADAFHAAGHEGQFITIIPSRRLVVVRLGLSRLEGAWDQETFIAQILAAISE